MSQQIAAWQLLYPVQSRNQTQGSSEDGRTFAAEGGPRHRSLHAYQAVGERAIPRHRLRPVRPYIEGGHSYASTTPPDAVTARADNSEAASVRAAGLGYESVRVAQVTRGSLSAGFPQVCNSPWPDWPWHEGSDGLQSWRIVPTLCAPPWGEGYS